MNKLSRKVIAIDNFYRQIKRRLLDDGFVLSRRLEWKQIIEKTEEKKFIFP